MEPSHRPAHLMRQAEARKRDGKNPCRRKGVIVFHNAFPAGFNLLWVAFVKCIGTASAQGKDIIPSIYYGKLLKTLKLYARSNELKQLTGTSCKGKLLTGPATSPPSLIVIAVNALANIFAHCRQDDGRYLREVHLAVHARRFHLRYLEPLSTSRCSRSSSTRRCRRSGTAALADLGSYFRIGCAAPMRCGYSRGTTNGWCRR